MSNHQHQQGQNDAQKGNGPKNTSGMNHQAANSYNAGYKSGKK
ncbi:hypothetical protein [Aquibaculum sediminis]